MHYLLDTNVVLRFANEDAIEHAAVRRAVQILLMKGEDICIVPQCLYESWAVMTRPREANGLGWSAEIARGVIDDLLSQWTLFPDTPQIFLAWLELVTMHQVSGKPTHDARLAAAAQAHGLDALLTLNPDHFKRFNIHVLTPADI